MSIPSPFASYDLLKLGWLDGSTLETWLEQALTSARPAVLQGGSSTSLEASSYRLQYRLLDGLACESIMPGLLPLYRDKLTALASRVMGREMNSAQDLRSAVNVNVLEGAGVRYEWHVDSNPLTGVLYLTSTGEGEGGRLLFKEDRGDLLCLPARRGNFFLFDARTSPHCVEELRVDAPRVSVPMNFYFPGSTSVRPYDLDTALYGEDRKDS